MSQTLLCLSKVVMLQHAQIDGGSISVSFLQAALWKSIFKWENSLV